MKKISVIICTHNRPALLQDAIESMNRQVAPKHIFEVVVVDNMRESLDEVKKMVDKYGSYFDIRYIHERNIGLSAARNRGIRESQSEYVAFLDDDAMTDRHWIKIALNAIDNKNPHIFGGPIFPFYKNKKPKWFKDEYESLELGKHERYLKKGEYLYGSNIFLKKNVFDKISFFDENIGMKSNKLSVGEESKLQEEARANNLKILYIPELKVFHFVPEYKMSLNYIIKRFLISAKISAGFTEPQSCFKNFEDIIKNFFVFCLLIMLYPFRNRDKYPYWQNYLIERFLHRINCIFRLLYSKR